jgi:hypothetical protein
MAGKKTNPAPQTEVLSVSQPRPASAEDLTPPNEGLPGQQNPEPDSGGLIQQPPMPTESLDQPPFEIDEGQPPEPSEPEPTHDPLKDTKAALTKTQQELMETKKLMQAILVSREFGGQPQAAPAQPPEWATPKYLPDELPTADPEWPSRFIDRKITLWQMRQQENEDRKEMERFARENPDFPEYLEDMRLVAAQNPGVFQGPRAIPALYSAAKKERRIKELEAKQAENRDRAMATGAQLARQAANQPFVSPKAGGGSVTGGPKVPPNFHLLSTEDQKKWLVQAGLYKSE